MVHFLHDDFTAPSVFRGEFIVSVVCGVVLSAFVLLVPAVKHIKLKSLYILKLMFCAANMIILLITLWWAEWFCGDIKCLDHVTGLSRFLSPTHISVHIGLDTLRIFYMVINSDSVFELTLKHSWDGNIGQHALDKYGDMLRGSVEEAPLPVTWIMEHFQSDIPGPQFGYSLQPWFYAAKVTLWIAVTTMVLSWLLILVGGHNTGSYLILLTGILQFAVPIAFIICTYKIHRKIFIGHQELKIDYSWWVTWILPLTGVVNFGVGLILCIVKYKCPAVLETIFNKQQVLFVESRRMCLEEETNEEVSASEDICTSEELPVSEDSGFYSSNSESSAPGSCHSDKRRSTRYSGGLLPVALRNSFRSNRRNQNYVAQNSVFGTQGLSETGDPFSIDFDNYGIMNETRVTYKYFDRESSIVRLNSNSIEIHLEDDAQTPPS